jgi:TRAP-type C4-dicarboxylate transport system permease small subunit
MSETAKIFLPARAPSALGALLRLDAMVQTLEVWLCAACLLVMIVLSFAQVLLRQFRTETLQPVDWFDLVSRYLVIWVGMLGASLCTAEGRHLAIEALPRILSPGNRRRSDALVSFVATFVTGVLCALSLVYLLRVALPDAEHNDLFVIESLGVKVERWPFLVIVPAGLLVVGWRFLLRSVLAVLMTDEEYHHRELEAEREAMAQDALEEAASAAYLESPGKVAPPAAPHQHPLNPPATSAPPPPLAPPPEAPPPPPPEQAPPTSAPDAGADGRSA